MAAIIADLQVTASLLHVRGYPSVFRIPSYIVHTDEVNALADKFLPRTKAHHEEARSQLRETPSQVPAAAAIRRPMLTVDLSGAQFRAAALKLLLISIGVLSCLFNLVDSAHLLPLPHCQTLATGGIIEGLGVKQLSEDDVQRLCMSVTQCLLVRNLAPPGHKYLYAAF